MVTFILATEKEDADGDVLCLDGIKFDQFTKAGRPVLWDVDSLPVGHLTADPYIEVVDGNRCLLGDVEFVDSKLAESVQAGIEKKKLRGGGISFVPRRYTNMSNGGHRWEEVDLLEFTVSVCK